MIPWCYWKYSREVPAGVFLPNLPSRPQPIVSGKSAQIVKNHYVCPSHSPGEDLFYNSDQRRLTRGQRMKKQEEIGM